jgi:hypothetical protein
MVDTFKPLSLTKRGLEMELPDYMFSWQHWLVWNP